MKAQMRRWCGWTGVTDPETLVEWAVERLEYAGFNIINEMSHHFSPFGFTALFLLAESHFAIHTFPEESKTYLELSSCVYGPFDKFVQRVRAEKTVREGAEHG